MVMHTSEFLAHEATKLPRRLLHDAVQNDILRYTIASVADAMKWGGAFLDFSYVVLPAPVLFALVSPDGAKSVIAISEKRDIVVRAQSVVDGQMSICERTIVEAAFRTFSGEYGEGARLDAIDRFRRLRDIDFAEAK